MGCLYTKDKWSAIEDSVNSAVSVLGLHKHEINIIVKVFHRYSQHFHLTIQQLVEALKEIKVTLTETQQKCYDLFLEAPKNCKFLTRQNLLGLYKVKGKMYSVKKLATIGIILGKGSSSEKAKQLFFNYDIDASNNLSKWELNVLIGDVLEIVLEIIPEIGKILNAEKVGEIEEFKASLMVMRKNLSSYFKYLVLEDRFRELDSEMFIQQMLANDTIILLEHSNLRMFAISQYEECKILSDQLKKKDENPDPTSEIKKPKRIKIKKKKSLTTIFQEP